MSAEKTVQPTSDTSIIRTFTGHDCGGKCLFRAHVKDGKLVRIESDDAEEPQQLRACLRGRAYRYLVNHPDRIKYPMKRVGARGEGKFERISWDEALETVARELIRVKKTYGNESILLVTGSGSLAALHSPADCYARLLSMFGGYSAYYGNVSSEGCVFAVRAQYGDFACGNSREDLWNSRLIIMWGWDPAKMIGGTNTTYYLIRAKEKGIRIISVDPRCGDTAALFADQWIPIRPGTDPAMLAAMAYVIIKDGLHDQKFLDKYTIGFDKYRDYVMGVEDGVPKTPAWAEKITGVPAATIESLAREYATTKPAALMDGQGPARSAQGEQIIRSTMTLAAMTGNVGIHGGHAGGGLQRIPIGEMFLSPSIPGPKNPVDAKAPSVRGILDLKKRLVTRMMHVKVWDAIIKGKSGGYPSDIKLVWFAGSNFLNQSLNTSKGVQALKTVEFILVPEVFMTPTARFADLVLPACSHWERNDLVRPWPSGPYYCYINKVLEPQYQSKSDLQIASELAPRLGISNYNDRTEDEWLREFVATAPDTAKEITDYDKFKGEAVHRVNLTEPVVAFKKQIEDPEHNKFNTPSGKIEIYSQRLADINDPMCPPIAKYVETWEGPNDPLAKEYPLQLITCHPKNRIHSQMDNIPLLREVEKQAVWLNPADAESRGIFDGEDVMVFNDRGATVLPAWVTRRIMAGVVCIYEGAWYNPDEKGIDRGGCPNVLTRDAYSPGGAFACNTALVQVRKIQ